MSATDEMTEASVGPAPGISLLVHRPGHEPLEAMRGYADLENGAPITVDTCFNVGSVAKQITAHLALLAAESGLLDLNGPVDGLLPELRVAGITPAELITHQSGLRDAESLLSLVGYRDLDHYTVDDLLKLAGRQRRRAVPRGQFLYSNTNYLLLARLLERLHDRPFPATAEDLLFGPLGMIATRFKTDPREAIPAAASAYEPTLTGWRHVAAPATLPGPGSLWSTAGDLSRWLTHLRNLWTKNGAPGPCAPFREHLSDQPPALYGPGLYTLPDQAEVFHYGHEQGFSAAVRLHEDGRQIISLSNGGTLRADHLAAAATTAPAQAIADGLATAPASLMSTATPSLISSVDPAEHEDLGHFTCVEVPGVLRLTRAEGVLFLWRRGTPCTLTRISGTDFRGPGLRLVLHAGQTQGGGPESFVVSLKRAPGLLYHLG